MSKNLIYCYSGSGNCLDIAKNIAKKLGDTDIVLMRTAPAITDAREAERVGFVFPCYAGGLPGRVEEYVRNVAVGRETYKFAVCSYAGYPGVGLNVIDSIVGLDYWAGISHQCSCIWLLPHKLMLPLMGPDKAQARAEKLAIVLGTEGDGLAPTTIARCDYTVKIPMSNGVDSLNVAAASAVAFWQLGRR